MNTRLIQSEPGKKESTNKKRTKPETRQEKKNHELRKSFDKSFELLNWNTKSKKLNGTIESAFDDSWR